MLFVRFADERIVSGLNMLLAKDTSSESRVGRDTALWLTNRRFALRRGLQLGPGTGADRWEQDCAIQVDRISKSQPLGCCHGF